MIALTTPIKEEVNIMVVYILLTIIFISGMYTGYILLRNRRVHRFVTLRNDLVYAWCLRHLYEIHSGEQESAYDWFPMDDPSYAELLHSFRPLKLSEWYSLELCEKLLDIYDEEDKKQIKEGRVC
jgi:hypothetical protein